jgi:hypothetical protein
MNQTVIIIVSIILGVLSLFIIINSSYEFSSKRLNEIIIKEHNFTYDNNNLIISWSTNKLTDAQIDYYNFTDNRIIFGTKFSEKHRIIISDMNNILGYNITSCDINKICTNIINKI